MQENITGQRNVNVYQVYLLTMMNNVASDAGINVPENRLIKADEQNIFLTKRFDRNQH